jgi:hypothetical protein
MGFKLAILMFIIMCGMGAAGKLYYDSTQARIKILTENNTKLEIAVETQEETMRSLQADFARANEEIQRVNTEFARTRQQNNVLADKLARHDLGLLGSSRPGLVERTINNASAKAGRCFELLSGAELTEAEKNATSANAFNSECPWLWSSSTTTQ